MNAHVENVTAGEISCPSCGDTAVLERGQTAMHAKIAAFWDAHHNCGRILIDLAAAERDQ